MPVYKVDQDPTFFFDLREHLNNNLEYRKKRIEYTKNKPWSLYRIKYEFFQVFKEETFSILENDLKYFIIKNTHLNDLEATQTFCSKYKGIALHMEKSLLDEL